jgi:hypothetical protein
MAEMGVEVAEDYGEELQMPPQPEQLTLEMLSDD